MRLSLMTHALRRGIWLAGFGLMTVSFVLQAIALHFGRLTEVQPILTTELLFLVLILGTWFRFTVGWREWLGAGAAAAGLAGFLLFAAPNGGDLVPGPAEWAEVGGSCLAVIVITVALAFRGPRWWRAAMFGAAAAVASPSPPPSPRSSPASSPTTGCRCSGTGRPTAWPSPGCWRSS